MAEPEQTWELRSLHQIELTSHCNLRCVYCPSPKLERPKLHMEEPVFRRTLEWVRHFVEAGTQGELNLAGIGESTLHPRLVEFVRLAREALGWERRLCFASNGIAMTDELAQALKPYNPRVWVSLHRPEAAKRGIDALREAGLLESPSCDPAYAAVDWAGQVDWKFSAETFGVPCPWKKHGWGFVLADGRFSSCCFDADGSGAVGHVDDPIGSVRGSAYKLCNGCHQDVGVEGFRDRVEGIRFRDRVES